MDRTAAACDTCPLRPACPCYVSGRSACLVGRNLALASWTAMLTMLSLLALLASAAS